MGFEIDPCFKKLITNFTYKAEGPKMRVLLKTKRREFKSISLLFFAGILLFLIFSKAYSQDAKAKQQKPDSNIAEDKQEEKSEKISLDLKGINITELFRLLSVKIKKTIVATKGVTGRVTLFLNNVTFSDALDVILITQGLAAEEIGNILMIMTSVEYKARYGKNYDENRELRSFKLQFAKPSAIFNALGNLKSDIGKIIIDEATGIVILIDIPEKLDLMEKIAYDLDKPLEMEIFDLNYADVEDIKAHLASIITEGTGSFAVDERSSKLIVTDLPQKMEKIKKVVRALDEESRQVFIEAEILQITLKKEFQKGINWERLFADNWLHELNFSGDFPVNPSFTPRVALSTTDSDTGVTTYNRAKVSIGTLTTDGYEAALKLLETFGDTKILSRPRITVLNNEEARILVGTKEAYITGTTTTGDTTTTSESIEFVDVGVKLNVVPQINKDGFIIMKIKPEISSVAETITTEAGSRVPIVDTSEAETKVKIKDGTMIMIAGLMKEEKRDDTTGIPFLSKIPLLGELFKSQAKLNEKTEIVIFIRPYIISGEAALAGTEYEKHIPPEILPEDVKNSIILKELEKIKSISKQSLEGRVIDAGPGADAKSAVGIERDRAFLAAEKEKILQEKLKGLKEY